MVFPVAHRSVDQISIETSIVGEYRSHVWGLKRFFEGFEIAELEKFPPGISHESLRNFLREAALSGDRGGRFPFRQPHGVKRHRANLKFSFPYLVKHKEFKNKGSRQACSVALRATSRAYNAQSQSRYQCE